MEKNKNIEVIDFGSYTLPRGWDELTLGQYQEIERYYSDKNKKFDVREVLDLLCDHSVEEISQLPIDFVDKLLNELIWLQENPEWGEPTNRIELNGEVYQVNFQEKMKTGEYIATDAVLKSDKHNYAAILAILCRKEGEIFDSKYENEVLPDRIKMWEKVSVVKVMPIVNFFLGLWLLSQKNSQLYSMGMELINHTAKDIETSRKNGALSRRSMRSAMKTLRKLEKSIKAI